MWINTIFSFWLTKMKKVYASDFFLNTMHLCNILYQANLEVKRFSSMASTNNGSPMKLGDIIWTLNITISLVFEAASAFKYYWTKSPQQLPPCFPRIGEYSLGNIMCESHVWVPGKVFPSTKIKQHLHKARLLLNLLLLMLWGSKVGVMGLNCRQKIHEWGNLEAKNSAKC